MHVCSSEKTSDVYCMTGSLLAWLWNVTTGSKLSTLLLYLQNLAKSASHYTVDNLPHLPEAQITLLLYVEVTCENVTCFAVKF